MGIKVITLSAIIVLASFANASESYREKRSPMMSMWPSMNIGDIFKHNMDMQRQIQDNIAAAQLQQFQSSGSSESDNGFSGTSSYGGASASSFGSPSGVNHLGMMTSSSSNNGGSPGSTMTSTSMTSVMGPDGKMRTQKITTIKGIDENGKPYERTITSK